jgi:hypothetical protein
LLAYSHSTDYLRVVTRFAARTPGGGSRRITGP